MATSQPPSRTTSHSEPAVRPLQPTSELPPEKADAILRQLESILASHRFATSPRCASLLRFVVEETLNGHGKSLKERTIGVGLFKRNSDYDNSTDPVVRVAVSEVRKKLAQYYYEPGNQNQVRISLPTGSYMPEFLFPLIEREAAAASEAPATEHLSRELESDRGTAHAAEAEAPRPKNTPWPRRIASLLALALVAAALAWYWMGRSSAFDAFWAPFMRSPDRMMVCVGQMRTSLLELGPNPEHDPENTGMVVSISNDPTKVPVTPLNDALALADVAEFLHAAHKTFAVQGEYSTSYQDLQHGPVVLIGALDNDWTMRMTHSMRFRFDENTHTNEWWIDDALHPEAKLGLVQIAPSTTLTSDLALVARVFDPSTKEPVVILGGLTPAGTLAAGSIVTDRAAFNEILKALKPGWEERNVELLLDMPVVGLQPGPVKLKASAVW